MQDFHALRLGATLRNSSLSRCTRLGVLTVFCRGIMKSRQLDNARLGAAGRERLIAGGADAGAIVPWNARDLRGHSVT